MSAERLGRLELRLQALELQLAEVLAQLQEREQLSTRQAAKLIGRTPQALLAWARRRKIGASRDGIRLVRRDGPRCFWVIEKEGVDE